jgi:hypothetical protein
MSIPRIPVLRFAQCWMVDEARRLARASPIIRILDRNGKGNTKDSEVVAMAMIPQDAWRRMFKEFHSNRELASRLTVGGARSYEEGREHMLERTFFTIVLLQCCCSAHCSNKGGYSSRFFTSVAKSSNRRRGVTSTCTC